MPNEAYLTDKVAQVATNPPAPVAPARSQSGTQTRAVDTFEGYARALPDDQLHGAFLILLEEKMRRKGGSPAYTQALLDLARRL